MAQINAGRAGRPVLVGLTGGIAAGKSAVARLLVELGAPVVDADQLAREVVRPGSAPLAQLVATFGEEILDATGALDRARMARRVFADPQARRALETITHPAIIAAATARIVELAGQGHRLIVYEAALLVESGRHQQMDALLVVVADDSIRRERLMRRDGLTAAEVQRRMDAQLPQSDKALLADYLIDNSGTLEHTRAQVIDVWNELRRLHEPGQEEA